MPTIVTENLALFTFLTIVLVGVGVSLAHEMLIPQERRGTEWALSQIFRRSVTDPPSIIAIMLTGTIVLLAFTGVETPAVVRDAFYLAIGFYFGSRVFTGKRSSGAVTDAQKEE